MFGYSLRVHREHLARDAHKLLDSGRCAPSSQNGGRDRAYDDRSRDRSRDRDNRDTDRVAKTDSDRAEDRPLEKRICRAVTAGFYMNSATLCAHGNVFKYLSLLDLERQRNRQEALDVRMVHIHPTSSLAIEGSDCPHTTLVYQALAHGNKLYMKQICRADSKFLKQLQRAWLYVDPYVLCGRIQERQSGDGGSGSIGTERAGTGTSRGSSHGSNEDAQKVRGANSSGGSGSGGSSSTVLSSTVGVKRPLPTAEPAAAAPSASAATTAAGSTPTQTSATCPPTAPSGANAAAEAAKQRYLERLAQQKIRK